MWYQRIVKHSVIIATFFMFEFVFAVVIVEILFRDNFATERTAHRVFYYTPKRLYQIANQALTPKGGY